MERSHALVGQQVQTQSPRPQVASQTVLKFGRQHRVERYRRTNDQYAKLARPGLSLDFL